MDQMKVMNEEPVLMENIYIQHETDLLDFTEDPNRGISLYIVQEEEICYAKAVVEDGPIVLYQSQVKYENASEHQSSEDRSCTEEYWKCPIEECCYIFEKRQSFIAHWGSHSKRFGVNSSEPVNELKCKQCNKTFIGIINFLSHKKSLRSGKEKEKTFHCDKCEFSFSTEENFNVHIVDYHETCTCEACGMIIKSRTSLHDHLRHHARKKPFKRKRKEDVGDISSGKMVFQCDKCKFFYTESNLKIHMFSCRGKETKTCNQSGSILNHKVKKSTSSGPPPKTKAPCAKIYRVKQKIQKPTLNAKEIPSQSSESATNTDEQLARECRTRQKKRKISSNAEEISSQSSESTSSCIELKDNIDDEPVNEPVTEINDFLYYKPTFNVQCDKCQISFTTKEDLLNHIQTCHKTIKTFKCEQCNENFESKDSLSAHEKLHTFFKCQKCESVFSTKGYLLYHKENCGTGKIQKVLTYKCPECPSIYRSKHGLADHKKIHSRVEKPFECKICGKGFEMILNLKRHLTYYHSEEVPNELKDQNCCNSGLDIPAS